MQLTVSLWHVYNSWESWFRYFTIKPKIQLWCKEPEITIEWDFFNWSLKAWATHEFRQQESNKIPFSLPVLKISYLRGKIKRLILLVNEIFSILMAYLSNALEANTSAEIFSLVFWFHLAITRSRQIHLQWLPFIYFHDTFDQIRWF